MVHEVRLERMGIGEIVLFHKFLCHSRLAPPLGCALVASSMNVFAWEKRANLVKHVVEESEHFGRGCQHVVLAIVDAPSERGALALAWRGAKFRVSGKHRHAVARYVDFGHHGHKALGGIVNHLFHFVLRVVCLIRALAIFAGEQALDFASAVTAFFGEFGVAFQLYSPALIVGEVPVENVQLMERNPVDILLHKRHREKVTRHVEVHTTIAKPWIIGNLHQRQLGNVASACGEHLNERGHTKETRLWTSLCARDGHAVARHGEGVLPIARLAAEVVGKNMDSGFALAFHNAQRQPQIFGTIVLQIFSSQHRVGILGIHASTTVDLESAVGVGDAHATRLRQHIQLLRRTCFLRRPNSKNTTHHHHQN